jgi:hypothetical protein
MQKHLKKNFNRSPLNILVIANKKTDKEEFDKLFKISEEYFNIT